MTTAIYNRIYTLLQGATGFASANVTQGDFLILDKGAAPYCVIYPGPFTAEPITNTSARIFWTYYAEVYEDFLDDDYTALTTARDAIVARLNSYPTLNQLTGVAYTIVTSGDDLIYLYPAGGADNPQFVGQRLSIEVIEKPSYGGLGEFA